MKRYFTSFLLVTLCYGLGLYSPAASARAQRMDYDAVAKYVNGKQKKSVREMFSKFGDMLPSNMVEEGLKRTKGKDANAWFDGVKMGDNYVYMRSGKVKLLAKLVTDSNGKNAVMLNGVKITLDDYRDPKKVEGLIFMAYLNAKLSKKGLFSYFFQPKAYAGEIGKGKGEPVDGEFGTVGDACSVDVGEWQTILSKPPQTAAEKQECSQKMQKAKQSCCSKPEFANNDVLCKRNSCDNELVGAAASGGNGWMWILGLGAAALLLFLLLKKDKKDPKPPEPPKPPPVDDPPEDETGVGRPPILCQGAEANCGGNTTYPDPPTYTTPSESQGSSSSDPYPNTGSNSNLETGSGGESSTGVGRQKTRARVKTK